jgi:hypothetical protein
VSDGSISLDHLAADIVNRSGLRFTLATDDATREIAYRLRYQAVVDQGWQVGSDYPDGREQDAYDVRAVHVLGWDADTPVATGRLVPPPGRLPTEMRVASVEPVDVGRMTWLGHQGLGLSSYRLPPDLGSARLPRVWDHVPARLLRAAPPGSAGRYSATIARIGEPRTGALFGDRSFCSRREECAGP